MVEIIDELSVVNRALARIGAGPIFALDEDSDQARQVMAVHGDLIDAALELWLWNWPKRKRKLEKLADAPLAYSASFKFPSDAIGGPVGLFKDPACRQFPLRDFEVEGRAVSADADDLYGVFRCRVSADQWPPAFRLAYTTWLAGCLCVPITQDANLAAAIIREAIGSPDENYRGGVMGRAIAMDLVTSGAPASMSAGDALTSAHFGAGSWDGGGSFGW